MERRSQQGKVAQKGRSWQKEQQVLRQERPVWVTAAGKGPWGVKERGGDQVGGPPPHFLQGGSAGKGSGPDGQWVAPGVHALAPWF